MKIVALHGPDNSGKDHWHLYASRYLEDPRVRRVAFADSVKAKAWRHGWNGEKSSAGRSFLWDISRTMNPNPTELGAMQILQAQDIGFVELVVLTDLRYKIEYQMLQNIGFGFQVVEMSPAWTADKELVSKQRAIVRQFALDAMAGLKPNWHYAHRTEAEIAGGLL
jgi:hypothetical protein